MHTRILLTVWTMLAFLGVFFCEGTAAPPVAKSGKATKTTTPPNRGAAKPTVAKPAGTASASQAHHPHTSILANVMRDLHEAEHMLHAGGHVAHHHRDKAIADIARAIHELEKHPHHQSNQSAQHSGTKAQTAHTHQQGATTGHNLGMEDTKLRHAEKLVHAAMHELHHLGTQASEHHHHIESALHDLKEAEHQIHEAMHAVHQIEGAMGVAVVRN